MTEDAELKGMKDKLQKAQEQLKKVDKEVEEALPYHIQQMEMQLARMKGVFEDKDTNPKSKINMLGNHGEITHSLGKVKEILEDFEEAVKDVKRLQEDIEGYEDDLKEEEREQAQKRNGSIVSSAMRKRPNQS